MQIANHLVLLRCGLISQGWKFEFREISSEKLTIFSKFCGWEFYDGTAYQKRKWIENPERKSKDLHLYTADLLTPTQNWTLLTNESILRFIQIYKMWKEIL